jgi:hypothetical protein
MITFDIMITKPTYPIQSEYFAGYVNKAKGEDLISSLKHNLHDTLKIFTPYVNAKEDYRYAEGKWSVKQLLQHIIDTERIFSYRALRISRLDATPLPGYDEDNYAMHDNSDGRNLLDMLREFEIVRQSTICLFESFSVPSLDFEGVGSGTIFTPRIVGWLLVGHAAHHNSVLVERYITK